MIVRASEQHSRYQNTKSRLAMSSHTRISLLFLSFLSFVFLSPFLFVSGDRVPIKINAERVIPSNPHQNRATNTNTNVNSRNTAPPPLFRQPNALTPPPFLQVEAAVSADFGLSGSSDHIFAAYYGEESHDDSNQEATFTAGSVAGGSEDGLEELKAHGDKVAEADAASAASQHGNLDPFVESRFTEEMAAWTQIDGHCWTHTTSTYVYSFCPYQNITQKSTTTTLHVVLGVWDTWIETGDQAVTNGRDATPSSSLIMSFTDGTACGNGKRRSTKVTFLCAADGARIGEINEPATCEYTVKFHTPLMCDRETIAAAQNAQARDNILLQAMRDCIAQLYTFASAAGSQQSIPDEILQQCGDFLPVEEPVIMNSPSSTTTTESQPTTVTPPPPPSTPSTPSPSQQKATAQPTPVHNMKVVGGRSLHSVTVESSSEDTKIDGAPIRANIPQTIIQTEAEMNTPSHSNAVQPDEPLNADASSQAASASPYAEIDDKHL